MRTIRITTAQGMFPADQFIGLHLEKPANGAPGAYELFARTPGDDRVLVRSVSFEPAKPCSAERAWETVILEALSVADILHIVHPTLALEDILGPDLLKDPTLVSILKD